MKKVYAVLDPETGEPRYIGCSTNPRKRVMYQRNDYEGRLMGEWLRSLPELPPIRILEQVGENWRSSERLWILAAWKLDFPLLNVQHIPGRHGRHVQARRIMTRVRNQMKEAQ